MYAGCKTGIKAVPKSSSARIFSEPRPRIEPGRAHQPEVVGVKHIVGHVANSGQRPTIRPGLRYRASRSEHAQGFEDFPNAAFILIHDPAMVVSLGLAFRNVDLEVTESDANAVAADACGH